MEVQQEKVWSWNPDVALKLLQIVKGILTIPHSDKLITDCVGLKSFLDHHDICVVVLSDKNSQRLQLIHKSRLPL